MVSKFKNEKSKFRKKFIHKFDFCSLIFDFPSDPGFTLLEVMVALAVAGGLLVTLLYTLNHHLDIAQRHETLTMATMLSNEKMSDAKKNPSNIEGQFDKPYSGYSYRVEIKDYPYPGVSEIWVAVNSGKESFLLKDLIWSPKE
jgi:general secretion pathway protein I